MKHDIEIKIFYLDEYCYFSLETTTPSVLVYFFDETSLFYFDVSLGYPTLEVK